MLDREHMQVGRSTSMLHDGVVLAGIERHTQVELMTLMDSECECVSEKWQTCDKNHYHKKSRYP